MRLVVQGAGRIGGRAVDQTFAELALWLGADRSALDLVLPNIVRFYSPASGAPPVGFLL